MKIETRRYRAIAHRNLDKRLFIVWEYEFYTEKWGWRPLINLSMQSRLKQMVLDSGKESIEVELPVTESL